jgi:hypothetical protein
MHSGINKGIIKKYSPMINESNTREHGANKRKVGEVVKIFLILDGYMDYRKVPEAYKAVC